MSDLGVIAEHIGCVETLVLNEVYYSTIDWNLFFNLRALSIEMGEIILKNQISFVNQTFPKLQTLCLTRRHASNSYYHKSEFDKFLENNAQLKNIFSDSIFEIECILSTASKLSNVVLNLHFCRLPLDELEECSKRKNIESIDISANITNPVKLQRVGQMTQVKSLHFIFDFFFYDDIGITLPYVQRLCVTYQQTYRNDMHKIVRWFPNLEELRIYFVGKMSMPTKDISLIIAGFPRLKYLNFYGIKRREIQENIIKEWDTIRSTLEKPPHLAIEFGFKRLYLDAFIKENYISVSTVTSRERALRCPICVRNFFEALEYMEKLSE